MKPWNKPWFSWDDMKDGGELVFSMGRDRKIIMSQDSKK